MKSKRKLLTPILGALLLVIVLLMVMATQRSGPPFVPPPVPSPNGFDDLQRAAKMLAPRTGFYDEMDVDELEQVVAANEAALKITRAALRDPIAMPMDWTTYPATGAQAKLNQVQNIRQLARALVAEARLNQAKNPKAAIQAILDALKMGAESVQGGLMVHFLAGLGIQTMAIKELKTLVEQHPELGPEVEYGLRSHQIENNEDAEEVTAREIAYINHATTGISGWLMRRHLDELVRPSVEATLEAELRATAQQELFLAHLVINAYYLKHSAWPKTLEGDALSMPLDPYSNRPFIYRVTENGYQLYSVGSNKVDDGGQGDATGNGLDFVYDLVPVK